MEVCRIAAIDSRVSSTAFPVMPLMPPVLMTCPCELRETLLFRGIKHAAGPDDRGDFYKREFVVFEDIEDKTVVEHHALRLGRCEGKRFVGDPIRIGQGGGRCGGSDRMREKQTENG